MIWRYHMDLDIPECQDAAFDFVEGLVKQYPWDGVNIAELNYDTEDGPNNPQYYIPMGASTRSAFRALGGFDPIDLFKPDSPYYWKQNPAALKKFEQYRTPTCAGLAPHAAGENHPDCAGTGHGDYRHHAGQSPFAHPDA